MRNFILFFNHHEGSSAIIATLNLFEKIYVVGYEPFDSYIFTLANNADIPERELFKCFKCLFDDSPTEEARSEFFESYLKYCSFPDEDIRNKYMFDKNMAIGFKMRFRFEYREEIIDMLEKYNVLPIFLFRQNMIKKAVSIYKGKLQLDLALNQLDPKALEKMTFDCELLAKIIKEETETDNSKLSIIEQLENRDITCKKMYYEDFIYNKKHFLESVLESLDISVKYEELDTALRREIWFKKVHSDNLNDIIANYYEVRERFGEYF